MKKKRKRSKPPLLIPLDDAKIRLAQLQGAATRMLRLNKLWRCANSFCKHSHPNEPIKGRDVGRGKKGEIHCPRCKCKRLVAIQSPRASAVSKIADRVRRATSSVIGHTRAGSPVERRPEDGWTMDLAPPVRFSFDPFF